MKTSKGLKIFWTVDTIWALTNTLMHGEGWSAVGIVALFNLLICLFAVIHFYVPTIEGKKSHAEVQRNY